VTQYDDVWVVSSPLMFLSNGYNDTSNIGTHRNIETALANSTLYRHIYKDFFCIFLMISLPLYDVEKSR